MWMGLSWVQIFQGTSFFYQIDLNFMLNVWVSLQVQKRSGLDNWKSEYQKICQPCVRLLRSKLRGGSSHICGSPRWLCWYSLVCLTSLKWYLFGVILFLFGMFLSMEIDRSSLLCFVMVMQGSGDAQYWFYMLQLSFCLQNQNIYFFLYCEADIWPYIGQYTISTLPLGAAWLFTCIFLVDLSKLSAHVFKQP